jgi:hypothetical protein
MKIAKIFEGLVLIVIVSIFIYLAVIQRTDPFSFYSRIEFKNKSTKNESVQTEFNYESSTQVYPFTDFQFLKSKFHSLTSNHCDVLNISADKCLDELKKLHESTRTSRKCSLCLQDSNSNPRTMFFHTYFHFTANNTNMLRMMNLNVMSFLATQNLCCSKLILWTLGHFSREIVKKTNITFDKYIKSGNFEIRKFEIRDLCRFMGVNNETGLFSSFRSHPICTSVKSQQVGDQVALSDFVRFFGKLTYLFFLILCFNDS